MKDEQIYARAPKSAKPPYKNDILTTYRPISQIQEAMNRLQSKRHLEQMSLDLLRRQTHLDDLHQRIIASQTDIDSRYQRITTLTSQIESASQIPDLIRRRDAVADFERRLNSEREALEQITRQNQSDRDEFDLLESELSRLRVSRERIIDNHADNFLSEQAYANNQAEIIQAILQKQQRTRKRQARKAAKQAKLQAEASFQAGVQAQRQAEIAKEQHVKAVHRLSQNQSVIDQARAMIKDEEEKRELKAVENVLKLKESIESSIQESRRHPRRVRNTGEERQSENQHREADIKVREMEVAARLRREYGEDIRLENKRYADAIARAGRQQQQQQQKHLQHASQQQKCTATEKELYPSQTATVKTRSFGTGRAPDAVLEMVRRRHPDVAIEPVERKRLLLPKASQHDVVQIADAVQRRQSELVEGRSKVVCGRQHTGPYFISDRSPVKFVDYVAGETASLIRFVLKNVSYCENAFRLVGVQDVVYREFFDVHYERRGRMSPGMGVTITVLFHGDIDQDLHTNLEFISEIGGAFRIPIQILMPKSNISISSTSLDFGRVVVGEEKQLSIQLTNQGALSATFSISFEDLDQNVFFMSNDAAAIAGHTSISLCLIYRPDIILQHHNKLVILLSNSTNQWASPNIFNIDLIGQCDDVPVVSDRERIEFGCCFIDDIYRDQLTLSNRAASLMHYSVSSPNDGTLTVQPRHGFLTGFGNATLHIELHANQETLLNYSCQESGRFEIPFEITPDGQDGIKVIASGILTHSNIEIDQDLIDFGKCYVGQCLHQDLIIRNTSLVMQRYGIVSDDAQLSVCPNTVHILPDDTAKIVITYQPSDLKTSLKSAVSIKSNLGRSRNVRCHGEAVRNPLEFSQSTVLMKPCGPGIVVYERIDILNNTQHDRIVEFFVSDQHAIPVRISPNILQIAAEQTAQVDIAFHAPTQLDRPESTKTEFVSGVFDSDTNTRYSRYLIPVFTRSVKVKDPAQYQTLYLQVQTTLSESQLALIDSSNKIEFGEIPLGQSKAVDICLRNISKHSCPLRIPPSLLSSPFLLSADPPLPEALDSGQTVSMRIAFFPKEDRDYCETICISDQINVTMHGIGASLKITLDPNNDIIDFGDVLIGDSRTVKLKLSNNSKFAIMCEMSTELTNPHNNAKALTLSPPRQCLEPNQSTEVVLSLRPDRDEDYNGEFTLRIPTSRYQRRFAVNTRSRSRQVFLMLPDKSRIDPALLLSTPAPSQVQLHMNQTSLDPAPVTTKLYFGSCQVETLSFKPLPASWEVVISEAAKKGGYLKITPAAGKLAPGELLQAEIQFDRQRWAVIYDPIEVISDIKELLQCTLQGGWAPPEQPTVIKFDIMCNIHLMLE